jgi:hypothetical protein
VYLTELTHPALARHDVRLVRWELFVIHDVRDVLPSSRPETIVVAHRGPAREDEWLAVLAAAGMLDEPSARDAAA